MREPRVFSPGELDFARRMAASLALALENSRLYEAEQTARKRAEDAEHRLAQELERTRILLKASDDLSSGIEPNELLERLARNVLTATGIERVFINLDRHRPAGAHSQGGHRRADHSGGSAHPAQPT